jgi:hypothetical protein
MGPNTQRRFFSFALLLGMLGFAQAALAVDSIKVGVVAPLTGPAAESGPLSDSRRENGSR